MLASRGARPVLTDIDPEARRAADEIAAGGAAATFFQQDVADEAGWEALVAAVIARFGRIDGLVNNAGVTFAHRLEELSFAEWRRVLAVNLDGVFLGTRAVVLAMRRVGTGGAIVN